MSDEPRRVVFRVWYHEADVLEMPPPYIVAAIERGTWSVTTIGENDGPEHQLFGRK